MKTQRQTKAEPNSDKIRVAKKVRGPAAKSTARTNGKNPLETYEHAPIGIVECSPDGKHLRANKEFCRLVGHEKGELVRKGIKAITHEDDYPIDIKLHQQLVEGKIPFYRLEKRYIRKDGGIIWVELTRSVVRDAARNPLYTIGVVLDISERKHVERVLRDSSERLRLATEAARMFTWELDFKTRIYTVADNFEQVLGFSAGLLSKNSVDTVYGLTPAEDIQAVLEISAKAIKNHSDLDSLQFRVINPENGQVVWLEANAKIVYNDEDGKPGRIFGVAQNITERKQAEEALRQSEERFVQFMEHLPGLAWIKDMQGRYVYANAAAEEAFSTPREKLYGKTDQDVFPPEVATQFKKNDEQALLGEKGVQVIETLEHHDGVLHYSLVSKFPIPGPDGDPAWIGGTAFDITERKQAEEALQQLNLQLEDRVLSRTAKLRAVNQTLRDEIAERKQVQEALARSEQEYRFLFQNSPVPMWVIDNESKSFVTINEAALEHYGYSREEFLALNISNIHPQEDLQRFLQTYELARSHEGLLHLGEWRHIKKDGSIINVDLNARDLSFGDKSVRLKLINDITERKRAEQALYESRKRLQILSQRLVEVQEEERRAIARELHDRVGQTLSALNINLVIMNGQILEDSKERIGSRLDDSLHLVSETITLVRDVMSNLRPSVLDDYGLEAALQSHLDEFISRYGIKVVLERPAQPIPRLGPSVEMTFLRIAQEALMNIARHANASQVILTLRQDDDAIRMTVQDNGNGIESWQEANRPGSHGLTIMRERAEAFGGNLHMASVPGKGTMIEVSIPIVKGNQNEVQKELRE